MPSPKSVSQIKSLLLSPALTSHFEVVIGIPRDLQSILGINQDRLNLMCSEASLPGSQLTTLELDNDRTGVKEKHVYRRMFDDRLDLTFYVDAKDYIPIRFFETWMEYITNEGGSDDKKSKNYSYRVKYPDDYISDQGLIVRKFERDYESVLEYEFVRSFPIAISSMSVSYDSSSLLKCQVSMSYIRYIVNGIEAPKKPAALSGRRRGAANPEILPSGFSLRGNILGAETFKTYAGNLNTDFFTPQGQANANLAFNPGLNLGLNIPLSEQISPGQQ